MFTYERADNIARETPHVAHIIFPGNYKTISNHIKVIPNIPTEVRMDEKEKKGGEKANQEFIVLVLERVSWNLNYTGDREDGKAETSHKGRRETSWVGRGEG